MEPLSHPTLRQASARLDAAQKPGAGVPAYMRWVNRRAARVLAAPAAALGMRPDAVTWISALVSAAGVAVLVLVPAGWGTGLLVAVLLALGFALDSADGQVSRITGTGSARGEWLDHVVDAVRTPAIHLSVAVALIGQHRTGPAWALVPLAFALVATGTFMVQILAEQLQRVAGARREQPGEGGRLRSLALLPVDFGVLCWCFLLWGDVRLFLAVYTALAVINAGYLFLAAARKAAALSTLGDGEGS